MELAVYLGYKCTLCWEEEEVGVVEVDIVEEGPKAYNKDLNKKFRGY
jgi:hypothetical protein